MISNQSPVISRAGEQEIEERRIAVSESWFSDFVLSCSLGLVLFKGGFFLALSSTFDFRLSTLALTFGLLTPDSRTLNPEP